MKIHDSLAEFWNWAYYNNSHRDCSWLLAEYVKKLKPDVENRVPVMMLELEDLLRNHRGTSFSLLDVGCGVGGFLNKTLLALPKQYPHIDLKATGIDVSSEMIDYAKKNLENSGIELINDDIANPNLEFKNEPFDAAILMVTLSFYDDVHAKEILKAIRNKLKTDGSLVIMDFAWSYKWKNLKLFAKPLHKLTDTFFSHLIGESFHFTNRTEDHLKSLLEESGYSVAKCYLSEKKSRMKGMLIMVTSKLKRKAEETIDITLQIPSNATQEIGE